MNSETAESSSGNEQSRIGNNASVGSEFAQRFETATNVSVSPTKRQQILQEYGIEKRHLRFQILLALTEREYAMPEATDGFRLALQRAFEKAYVVDAFVPVMSEALSRAVVVASTHITDLVDEVNQGEYLLEDGVVSLFIDSVVAALVKQINLGYDASAEISYSSGEGGATVE